MKKRGSALGSSSSTEGFSVKIGRLGSPNGLDGFIGIYIEPDDLSYLEPGMSVAVSGSIREIRALRQGKKGPQVAFVEITRRDQAETLRGQDVLVSERRSLGGSEFWPSDLVGLEVRPGGGIVTAVNHGPVQDRLEIDRAGSRFEIPFVDDLVPVVDLEAGFVEIVEIEGLIPLPDPE